MSSACIISEINYPQNCYKKLSEECKLGYVDLTDNNIKVASGGNCELLGSLINIFKNSVQTVQPSKSSKYNIVSNESSGSNLVNKAVTSAKSTSNAIAGTICSKPAIQDFLNSGCDNVGSSKLIYASISTSGSTIGNYKIGSPAASDQRTYSPTGSERSKSIEVVIKKSGNAADDDKKSRAPAATEIAGPSAVAERSGPSRIEKRGHLAVTGRNGPSTVMEKSVPEAVQEKSVASAVKVRNVPSSVEEKSGPSAFVNRRMRSPNFSRGKTESYKSPINISKETNRICTSPSKSVYEYFPENKTIHSSKLSPESNFDTKINSKQTSDREKFMETINSVNMDMVKKSRKLLQQQTLVSEMVSYIQATQSVCRLLLPRNRFVDDMSTDEKQRFDFSSKERFHCTGEYILEELQLYLNYLKADFRDWEAKRKAILCISQNIPKQFELCYSKYSARVLMHDISTGISYILQEMNDITTKREERNIEFAEIWEGTDRYIKFSSYFIID